MKQRYIDVIQRRLGEGPYAATGPQTLVEVSRAYGVTRQRIYQLERTAWKNLLKHYASTTKEEPRHQQEGYQSQPQGTPQQTLPFKELEMAEAPTDAETEDVGGIIPWGT